MLPRTTNRKCSAGIRLNIPDSPTSDIIVEKNELVISTHGGGFWVLDNLAPVRAA